MGPERWTKVRAGKTTALGTSGQSFTKAWFEAREWAAVANPEHDLGTDLWVTPRDRGFDLGVMLGVQVKNGGSYRKAPATVAGRNGWWLRASREHLEYWLGHAVPHVLVVRDPESGIAHWAHVTAAAVVWTKKNGKVFIPRDNLLDAGALEPLAATAATIRTAPTWAGSAWNGAPDLTPNDQLRFAMLAPRLIAPHPNRGATAVDAHEAIALVAAGRFGELSRYGLDRALPDGWRWGFYEALLAFAESQEVDELRKCLRTAIGAADVSAATAAVAAALVETGQVDEALSTLDTTIARDVCEPVDYAWLLVHRARCLVEIGRHDEAIADALLALPRLRSGDVTAAAIAGAGARTIFFASGLEGGDVAATIAASDTEATWWLTQSVSWGLEQVADDTFRRWVGNTDSLRWSRSSATSSLRGATLVAGFSAMHGHWSSSTALLAQAALMNATITNGESASHLTMLRRSGNHETVGGVVGRLLSAGPAEAIRIAAADIDMERLTRTDARAAFELITRGGDVIHPTDADRLIEWSTLPEQARASWLERVKPPFMLDRLRADVLRSLVLAASPRGSLSIKEHVVQLPPLPDQAVASSWARLLDEIPSDEWSYDEVQAVISRVDDHWELRDGIIRLGFARDDATRSAVLEKAVGGDLDALRYVRNFGDIPLDAVVALRDSLAQAVRKRQHDVAAGFVAIGRRVHPERVLTILNALNDDGADWSALIEMLEAPVSVGADLALILEPLNAYGGKLRQETKDRLATAVEQVLNRAPVQWPTMSGTDPRAAALAALGSLRPETASVDPTKVGRDVASRQTIAISIARRAEPASFQTLAMMACDEDPAVRATTASCLTHWAVEGIHPMALSTVQYMLQQDDGIRVARAVSVTLPDAMPPELRPLAEQLTTHLSAFARHRGRACLAPDATAVN